uniref:Uncharacterized protein n=1 Tax=Knipowitschia caucasica TaxID=637954 RepID=A0AAV2K0M8_KNICA
MRGHAEESGLMKEMMGGGRRKEGEKGGLQDCKTRTRASVLGQLGLSLPQGTDRQTLTLRAPICCVISRLSLSMSPASHRLSLHHHHLHFIHPFIDTLRCRSALECCLGKVADNVNWEVAHLQLASGMTPLPAPRDIAPEFQNHMDILEKEMLQLLSAVTDLSCRSRPSWSRTCPQVNSWNSKLLWFKQSLSDMLQSEEQKRTLLEQKIEEQKIDYH